MIYAFYGLAALIVFALCVLAVKDYRRFLFLGAFILNFHAISIDVGVLLNIDKVFGWIGAFTILLAGLTLPHRRWFYAFAGMIGYMTLLTAFMLATGALNDRIAYAHSMGLGSGQTTQLFLVQLVSQLTMWIILLVGYTLGRCEQVINGFVWGAVCNAGLGFYQLLATIKHLPWLPPELLSKWSGNQPNAQFQIQHSNLYRLAGLAGEPKHAAACFVFAIVLMMCFPIKEKKWKLPVLALALLATLSTSGWFAFAVIYGVFMFYRRKFVQLSIAGAFVLLIILGTQVSSTLAFIVDTRIVMRVADPESFEPKDSALLDVAKHNPEIFITGAGAGGISLFLMQWVKTEFLERGGAIGPTYLPIEILGDYGVIGLTLFALLLLNMKSYFCGDLRVFYFAAVIALLMLPRFSVMSPVLLVVGSLMRSIDVKREASKRKLMMQSLEHGAAV